MRLNRLKSVAHEVIRTSIISGKEYMIDPFEHHTPEFEITVDLIMGTLSPDRDGDDVERYYTAISKWFRDVLTKEGILIENIDEAVIKLTPKEKKCIIKTQGKEFTSLVQFIR